MTTSQGPWPGKFVWHDLMTTDGAKAVAFYQALFGWQIESRPMPGCVYHMIHLPPGPMGGIMQEKVPVSNWLPYLAVTDVDATFAKIKQLGGKAIVPPTDIPQTGRFAVVVDPFGGHFAIYKGNPGTHGLDPSAMVEGRICWNELMTTDLAGAQTFYSAVFGWQPQPMPMGDGGTYHLQMLGGSQTAGLMKHPQPGAPSLWASYFFVMDLKHATIRAKELGATAMMENTPIPGIGAFSALLDPTGAFFALFEPVMPGAGGADCQG